MEPALLTFHDTDAPFCGRSPPHVGVRILESVTEPVKKGYNNVRIWGTRRGAVKEQAKLEKKLKKDIEKDPGIANELKQFHDSKCGVGELCGGVPPFFSCVPTLLHVMPQCKCNM